MGKKTLTPRNIFEVEGKLTYSEGFQGWNLIRLKEEFVKEFPDLKNKRSKFTYKLMFHRNPEELSKIMKDLDKTEAFPVLMFLYKDDKE